jgi:divalent metal cation (Fe/Co/Zn/Cd) transporter
MRAVGTAHLRPSRDRRSVLRRRGVRLEYATLGWNIVEIGFLVLAAVAAHSVALAGFAFDSVIEIFASVVVIWHFKDTAAADDERHAVRLIGLAFFALSIYVAIQAVVTVALDVRPAPSPLGITWLAATCVVMFILALAKSRTGAELGSAGLSAEAMVTAVDGALAAGSLTGLLLNALLGWWRADIGAGAILVVYASERDDTTCVKPDPERRPAMLDSWRFRS